MRRIDALFIRGKLCYKKTYLKMVGRSNKNDDIKHMKIGQKIVRLHIDDVDEFMNKSKT